MQLLTSNGQVFSRWKYRPLMDYERVSGSRWVAWHGLYLFPFFPQGIFQKTSISTRANIRAREFGCEETMALISQYCGADAVLLQVESC